MTIKLAKNSAPGSMAGYLFQPERALYWLVCSGNGSLIGIETEDDIVRQVKENAELNVREQAKHSITSNIPFGDHSKDLWNTLGIWLSDVATGKVNYNNTQFQMVTNKEIESGLVLELEKAKEPDEIKQCISKLRNIAKNTPQGIKAYVDKVISYNDQIIGDLIKQIVVCDRKKGSSGDKSLSEMKTRLMIPDHIPFNEVYNSLLGWVHSTAMSCWRNGIQAWLGRDAFIEYYHKLISRYETHSFVERPKALIPITNVERQEQANAVFVRQLYLLAIESEDNLLIDAIDDYLMSSSERIRLSVLGDITKEDIDKFDDALKDRWKMIHAVYRQKYKKAQKQLSDIITFGEESGLDILHQTLNHREPLAGQQTEQFYLTRGSYHRLADAMEIGWHPDYKILIEAEDYE
ncbi:ABC-three component system protein [Cohnella mopanensis]|uniref:ABC-three component system protein n=1 Tax=Cohnella mopanensis TaxID=2911966 RepID=UPI001EF7E53B|nr:ABC-three component system protein [Cohnella mopanensis]